MNLEEAIAVLEESKRQNEIMRDNPSTFWASYQMADGVKNSEKRTAALDLALTALRPVSPERVEKVWRGEWINVTNYTVMGLFYGICSKCHEQAIVGAFCNKCGAPMTDEAVEIVVERLETLYGE